MLPVSGARERHLFRPALHSRAWFGEKIIVLRKQFKWSQDDLAKKIGTSAPIIGRYEREEITPSIDVTAKIADALNVTVDYLIGQSDQMVMDKNLVRRMEDIEALPKRKKIKCITSLIWLWLTIKLKKPLPIKQQSPAQRQASSFILLFVTVVINYSLSLSEDIVFGQRPDQTTRSGRKLRT